jgi:hypothetical protein
VQRERIVESTPRAIRGLEDADAIGRSDQVDAVKCVQNGNRVCQHKTRLRTTQQSNAPSELPGFGLQHLMGIGMRRYEHIAAVIGVPRPNLIGELTAQLSFAKPGSRAQLAIYEVTRR